MTEGWAVTQHAFTVADGSACDEMPPKSSPAGLSRLLSLENLLLAILRQLRELGNSDPKHCELFHVLF